MEHYRGILIGEKDMTRKRSRTLKVSPAAIILNRFDTRCGACMKLLSNDQRQIKACPHCNSIFTHVTTDCNPVWMKSVVKALRTDLEYIDFGDLP